MTGDYTRVTPPGQEGTISVTLNTRKFNKPISKAVNITTNAPKSKRVVLTMKANVKSPLEILPADRADFRVYHGDGGSRLLALYLLEETEARLVSIQSNNELFTIDWGPYTPSENPSAEELEIFQGNGRAHRLEISLSPAAPVGYQSGRITIYLEGTAQKQLDIKALARVMGRIHFTPQWIYFGSVTANGPQEAEQLLEVRSHGEAPFTVTGVEYQGLPVTWEIRPLASGSGTDILFRWDGSEPAGIHKGRVVITTDNAAQPRIEVPFSINVLREPARDATAAAENLP